MIDLTNTTVSTGKNSEKIGRMFIVYSLQINIATSIFTSKNTISLVSDIELVIKMRIFLQTVANYPKNLLIITNRLQKQTP